MDASGDSYGYVEDGTYCYPGTSVLRNRLDIRDATILRSVERRVTALRIAQIDAEGIAFGGRFDSRHLRSIHRFVFGDLYPWAGDYRTVDISKGSMFCLSQFIPEQLDALLGRLGDERLLDGLGRRELVSRLAFYLGEINAIHPFREGNGRTQRVFIRQLAGRNGRLLSFAGVTESEMVSASIRSFQGDNAELERLIDRGLGTR